MTSHLWWYAARSGGFVAWGLLAASVVWGLMLSTKMRPGQVRPNWLLDLHRFLGGLAVVFTGIHVASIVADTYTHFGVADVLVPFASSWKPGAVAWGIVGMYFLAAVELTSLLKKRLPKRVWHGIHLLSFPLYITATLHLLLSGTDSSNPLTIGVVTLVTGAIGGLTGWRIATARQKGPSRVPANATAAARAAAARTSARTTRPTSAPATPPTYVPPAGYPAAQPGYPSAPPSGPPAFPPAQPR